MRRTCFALAALLAAAPAMARNPELPELAALRRIIGQAPLPTGTCQTAIAMAEASQAIPAGLLAAIGTVESGRRDASGSVRQWPWTINAGGVGSFFDTRDQAIAAVRELQAQGLRSIDVGCVQINLAHHPNAFASLEQAFDPVANTAYGARFLASLRAQLGNWDAAVAGYHSMTPGVGQEYARRVMAVWQKGQPDGAAAAAYIPTGWNNGGGSGPPGAPLTPRAASWGTR